MFLIIGISQTEKRLNFDQLIVCKQCGKYGHIEVFMSYTYLMLFFIPIFKWNKHYYARVNCCGSSSELNAELGKAIVRGEITSLNPDTLNFGQGRQSEKHCTACGFTTTQDYRFCPKCGKMM